MAKNLFYMEKRDGRLKFSGDHQEQTYLAFVKGLPDRQVMKMELAKNRVMKTNPQLGYWHATVLKHAVQGFIDNGHDSIRSATVFGQVRNYAITKADVDEYLKAEYAASNNIENIGKAKMSDEQMSELISWTKKWCAEWLHTVIPEPERTAQ